MAGHGNTGRIGGHEIQVSVRLAGRARQSVRGKPRLESRAGFRAGASTMGSAGSCAAAYTQVASLQDDRLLLLPIGNKKIIR